jgi:hypothetical protein
MSDPLFNSKRDQAKLLDDDCTSTLEVEQVGTPAIGTGASDTWDVGQSFELNQEATSMPSHGTSAPEVMGIAELTSSCFKEIRLYQDGELEHEMYCMELLRRATLQGNQDAWKSVQELLGETVRSWIAEHPSSSSGSSFFCLSIPKRPINLCTNEYLGEREGYIIRVSGGPLKHRACSILSWICSSCFS